ncbi:MAG: hypothetical protein BGO51_06540 [Rhodospirillales bacterium 69-11]|nr:tRNA (adenosine(37)-N6)-threonylcarbamoyltransferase complex ATPase subunit type 1 TsaE [Rhodospirillales bacterium]OJW26697.1 MAG: hypothetical protein BGO51_06540 [Rhodospirillales bacterium 69-11]
MTDGAEPELTLTPDQEKALGEILEARKRGRHFLLSGYAGTGKTTLMQRVAQALKASGQSVAMTAPTYKAVAVLSKKLKQCGLGDVPCLTIHSLLSLRAKPYGDRLVFQRAKHAEPVKADVVVVDECSMVDADLMGHIRRHLQNSFVLFVGDPAQLPPVEERESQTFATPLRSHLDIIVRQAAGNPILDAATAIRKAQGGPMDWSWCKSANAPPLGVYMPGRSADAWLEKAFTSPEFEADPDTFRFLAWTNARVAEVNTKIRRFRYGDNIPTPFMPGERALMRAPVIKDSEIKLNTNEEATVLEIGEDSFSYHFEACGDCGPWAAEIPSWRVKLKRDEGGTVTVHTPSDEAAYNRVIDRIKDEATFARYRWKHLHDFQAELARMQSIYGMTVHTSQGSTFQKAFVDVGDIRRRERDNLLEAQQLFYVAVTRPSEALYLVGV